ncbi:MAG: HEAT repeat domain-containing protein [Armatimonadota bacterium]|nr:sister chromatid cohesion protein PDS5 [bacterium]
MAKSFLQCAVVITVTAMLLLLPGCSRNAQGQANVSANLVKQALSPGNASVRARVEVAAAGDEAIPLIFDEMRSRSRDPYALYGGLSIVRQMAESGKADSSAPYIRKVLLDASEPDRIRTQAVLMLYWFWKSDEVRQAVESVTTSTPAGRKRHDWVHDISQWVVDARMQAPNGVIRRPARDTSTGNSRLAIPVTIAGETTLPILFDGIRDNPLGTAQSSDVFQTMSNLCTADPTAPYIRSVLANRREQADVRLRAASALANFKDSGDVIAALEHSIRSDSSPDVREGAVVSLGSIALHNACRTNWNIDHEIIDTLSAATKDKNALVRFEACSEIREFALNAPRKLEWAERLLAQCSHDPDKKVRQLANFGLQYLKRTYH